MTNIEKNKCYSFDEAINIIKNQKKRNFKETIDASIQLKITPKKKNISIKGHSLLPNKIEKKYKICVFLKNDEKIDYDKNDIIHITDKNINDINKKNINFNIILTTPKSIVKLGKLTKILNAKKIMPDIKYGTLTNNINESIKNIKNNYIKFKNNKNNIINSFIGKIDLENNKLKENIEKLITDIKKYKPKECKSLIIKKINISSTMGPGIKININSLNI